MFQVLTLEENDNHILKSIILRWSFNNISNTTDLNIFTNSYSIKMVDRMKTILSHAEYFYCFVGYFKITGFYLLKESLEKVKEIRFLVGLGTYYETSNAITLTLFNQNAFKIKPILQK